MMGNIKKFIINFKFFFLNHKNQEIVRFIKSKTPPFIKMWVSSILFKEELKEARYVYSLLNQWKHNNFKSTSDSILNFQEQKLSHIIKYAYNFSPYYTNIFDENKINIHNINDFFKIPLLDKVVIRKNKDQLFSKNLSKIKFTILNTGGSTGEPMDFPASYRAGYIDRAHQQFALELIGYEKGDKIFAFDGSSVPNHLLNKNIYWVKTSNEDLPFGRLSYSSLYLNKNTIKYYVNHFLKSKPCILRGYPSFINDVAEYILANNININFMVKGIQLTAENAFDWQVENIKKAFKTKVFFQYGHSEMCVFGFTKNETYEYFCSPFYGLTEIINDKKQRVKEGEIGEIIATSFYHEALPFIRYRTGDWALFDGIENGFVKLKRIEGRTQDFIYNKNKEKISITAIVFGQHYQAFRNIKKWQIYQSKIGEIIINIVKGENFSENDELEIVNKFKNIGNFDVMLNFVDKIELTIRGKYRFVVVDKTLFNEMGKN